MIYGFAFKSPDVVRFLIPASSYAVCIVPSPTKPHVINDALKVFASMPIGQRKRVYMYKSIQALLTCVRNKWVDIDAHYHIVFDALSLLNTKPCVKVLDIEFQKDATWQLKKTLSGLLVKTLETCRLGIDANDLSCLQETTVFPEDMIHTDKKSSDQEKQNKTKSFLHVIQDLQSKNADKRNAIAFWICAGYAGVLLDKQHVVKSTEIVAKWTPRNINVLTFSDKRDPTARQRIADKIKSALMQYGFEIKKSSLAKVMGMIGGYEYKYIMRALLLMQECKYSAEKASNETGANVSAVSLIWRYLRDESNVTNMCIKHKKEINACFSIPKKCLKPLIGVEPSTQVEPEVKHRKKIEARRVGEGKYTVVALVQALGLAGANKTAMQVHALSKTPIKVIGAVKYNSTTGEPRYLIKKNAVCYVRFGGKKYKIKGV